METNDWSTAIATLTVYVATDGNDGNTGTIGEPLRSLDEALKRTRAKPPEERRRIVVRGGSYYGVGVVLTAEDSNLTIEAYPDENPVLYGGHLVDTWAEEGSYLTAPLRGTVDFRLIEANGEPRTRARLPETGAFEHLSVFDVDWMSTYGGGWKRKPTDEELTTLRFKPEDVGTWLDPNNAEATIYHEWDESLVGVEGVDHAAGALRFSEPAGHPPGAFAGRNDNARKYVLWNVKEGMKRPGQWYADKTNGKLVYWPLPSETPDNLRVVVPDRERVVELRPGANRIRLAGLTFSCAGAPLSQGGFGAKLVGAAIEGEDVEQVTLENVAVRYASGWACRLKGRDIRLSGCRFHDAGAGGVHLVAERATLERSVVRDVGLVYKSAVGVFSEGSGNVLSHNEIHGIPYSGIVSVSPESQVTGNLLYDTVTFMKDGAAIYIAMDSANTFVTGNAVFSQASERERRYAYYLDEKCVDCAVENNLAVNLGLPMLSHMTYNSRFANNIFIDRHPQTVSVLNSYGVAFERNVLIAPEIEIRSPQGNPDGMPTEYDDHPYVSRFTASDGIVSMKDNVIRVTAPGCQAQFDVYLHYKSVGKFPLTDKDGNAFADPLYADPAGGDFSFEPESPAPSRGIMPLSFAEVGCEGRYRTVFERFNR